MLKGKALQLEHLVKEEKCLDGHSEPTYVHTALTFFFLFFGQAAIYHK